MCLWGAIIHLEAWCPHHHCFVLSPGLPFQVQTAESERPYWGKSLMLQDTIFKQ